MKPTVYHEQDVSIDAVCETLSDGGVILYPTDTLYALGADPKNTAAMNHLFSLKQRPAEKKVSYIFSDLEQVAAYAHITDTARSLSHHLPGKVTLILESKERPGDTIGVRIPAHTFCRDLASAFGPVTATSANISGDADPHTVREVLDAIPDGIALMVDGGTLHGPASTVVDARGDAPKVFRAGAVSL